MNTQSEENENTTALKRALFALKDMRAKLDAVERAKTEPIAIIGMGCRFPGGANSPEQYWKILDEGIDVIREVPPERWDIDAYYDSDQNAPGKMYVRKSGFIDDVDKFEPQFFNISPREAMSLDPQQRLLLEVTWEALENAGIVSTDLAGSQTGVFIGMSTQDYSGLQLKSEDLSSIDAYVGTGTSFSVAAGRIAYVLGLHGPTLAMDTACSSALVAVNLAVQSLRAGQSQMALAGGVSLILAPEGTVSMSKSHALSPDGYCKTFDASADGYGRGEGCGMVVLKRLSDALADGDTILALIRGTAINHDGRSSGLTVPNGQAQQAVIKAALADAGGIDPHLVHYIETHGTGTQLGDPIEVRALANVLSKDRPADRPLILGSVKANIGHLEAAAGMAGLIKTILVFQHDKIPAQVHFKEPNPMIDWDTNPVKVAGAGEVWPRSDVPRIAGLNAFGFSGTNAHLVVQEPPLPEPEPEGMQKPLHLLALSAKDAAALSELAGRFAGYLETHPGAGLAQVVATANARRTQFPQRMAVIAASTDQMREKLSAFAAGDETSGLILGTGQLTTKTKIAFLFTGQGSQYIQMGRQLYETQPVFRAAVDRCAEILQPYLPQPLLSVLYPQPGEDSPIDDTAYTQPALFALEYALAELWRSWGIQPSAVMGHSVGEYVAACVAGLFSLEDGLKLIAERGRLMQSLRREGIMAAVFASRERVEKAVAGLADQVSIAAVNGPENIVISGRDTAVQSILDQFAAQGVKATRLTVSHAFHSPLMDSILDAFAQAAASITFTKPKVALISNVTGQPAVFEQISQPDYWRQHIRQPVQFQASIETLRSQGIEIFLEIGPQPTLLGMAQRFTAAPDALWLASLRQRKDDWLQMQESLGALYVRGIDVDWKDFHRFEPHRPIALPTYPFQRQRYWFHHHKKAARPEREMLHPLIGRKIRSPKLDGVLFETELGVESPPYLNDHRIFDAPIFPGTGYFEMALAAAKLAFNSGQPSLSNFGIREPMLLPEEGEKTVQVIVSPLENGKASVEIFSLDSDTDPGSDTWKQHAVGKIRMDAPQAEQSGPVDIEQLKQQCPTPTDVPGFYRRLAGLGIVYGPAFQALSQIFAGTDEALGSIVLPVGYASDSARYGIHPVLLDAAFHLLDVAAPPALRESSDKIFVPVGFKAMHIYQTGQSQAWAHAAFTSSITNEDGSIKDALKGDIRLFGPDGALIAEITGLQIHQINRDAIRVAPRRKVENWLYEVNWQTAAKPAAVRTSKPWLVFAGESGVGEELAQQIAGQGAPVVLVRAGADYRALEDGSFELDPTQPGHFNQLLDDARARLGEARPEVLHLWGIGNTFDISDRKTDSLLRETQKRVYGSVLYLVQALAEKNLSPDGLWLVTHAAHAVRLEDSPESVVQAGLWGLGRTIALEYPHWKCACLDVDSAGRKSILEEILAADDENQIALRGGDRYTARLDHASAGSSSLVVPDEPFELDMPSTGVLDQLTLKTVRRVPPGRGEVEIRVRTTGLNFRDVLNALGMYPGAKIPLGNECAGVVVAVGEGVTEFALGDEVIGLTTGAFRAYATVPVERVFTKPAGISFADAVSIPTTFLTAAYGLHHLAGMQAGDRVLIHAAAGGVGMAAVQLALRAGAEVFATAGSPEKRAFLTSMGVQHVMNSRTLDFADEMMQITGGQGVNIVLNSLSDEFIPKSLSVLSEGGCFLEIGKRDDWDQAKVSQHYPGRKYYRYDLGAQMVDDLPFIGGMLKGLLADLEQGSLHCLPVRAFPMESVREAFRFMAQARHIGKIVITQEEDAPRIREDGSYLITGGLGGLGLVTARWLVERGAKSLVLTSRRPPTEQVEQTLTEMRAQGAQVVTIQADVSVVEDVERILQTIQSNLPPLRGVFHEAGVLDDGILSQQTWERFERVLQPKISGAWHLHALTQHLPLDFFVLFSTAAAVIGSAGQGNYAAANASLDALAHYRRARGLPALSINWGAWAEVGMAAELDRHNPNRRTSRDADLIKPEEGMRVLDLLLARRTAQAVVLPVNWEAVDGRAVQPLLRKVVKAKSGAAQAKSSTLTIDQIKAMPLDERKEALLDYSRRQVIAILGLDPSQPFDSDKVLTNLGMDSLMAVELKNKIVGDLSINIDVTYFLEEATAAGLAQKIMDQLGPNGAKPDADETVDSEKAQQLLSNLDQMSEDEVNALLNDLLTNREGP